MDGAAGNRPGTGSVRVFALSDVHADFSANRAWLEAIPSDQYNDSVLILAGDVSHNLDRIEATLETPAREVCRSVCLCPEITNSGSRRRKQFAGENSGSSYNAANPSEWRTHPVRITVKRRLQHPRQPDDQGVWIVPLYSWYLKPEEGSNSLFVSKPGEDPELRAWSDNRYIRWAQGSGS